MKMGSLSSLLLESDHLQNITRTVLEEVILDHFLNGNSCRLKRIENGGMHYGRIDLTDVVYSEFKVTLEDHSEIIYKSIDGLLKDGWLVS